MRRRLGLLWWVAVLSAAWPAAASGAGGWTVQPMPRPAATDGWFLNGVSCPTATACTAVGRSAGQAGRTLAARWDGSTWAIQATPDPPGTVDAELRRVSCPTARACVAVGSAYGPSGTTMLAEHWDGATWRIEPVPEPAGSASSRLAGVSCRKGACVAGRRWEIAPVAVPAGVTFIRLADVACSRARTCIAVGDYVAPAGTVTLAMRWDGRRWTVEPTPNPVGAFAALTGVSCPGRRACVAVGPDAPSVAPFAERWDGRAWQLEPVLSPPGGGLSSLQAVSCPTRRACTAVGFSVDATGATVPLALRWSGRG